ncbi:MAG: hypothetical protein IK118_08230 [Clostridia bacterium]|nr:hypothetical protein [Clostridia bacterium]
MKKTKKLISVILAIVMTFSVMSAAIVASAHNYTKVKDFRLNAEESATLLLDYVDAMLAENAANSDDGGQFTYSLNLGLTKIEVLIDYTSIDKAISSVTELLDKYWGVAKGLVGDAGKLDYSDLKGVQRSGGDLNLVYAALRFLDKNSGILAKVVKGDLSLGAVNAFFNVNDFLAEQFEKMTNGEANNIPDLAKYYLYGALLSDKWGYDKSWKASNITNADQILNEFVTTFLTTDKPSEFSSALLPSLNNSIDLTKGSVYGLLAQALTAGLEDLGRVPFNNDLKAIIAQYVCEGTKTEITDTATDAEKAVVPETQQTAFADSAFGKLDENTYIFKDHGKIFKFDMSNANTLYQIFNLEYKLPDEINILGEDGTLTSNINNILGLAVKTIKNEAFDFEWKDGGNELLTENIANLAKKVLPLVPDKFFGSLDAETIASIKKPAADADPTALVNYFTNILLKTFVKKDNEDREIKYADADRFIEFGVIIANSFASAAVDEIDYSDKIYDATGKVIERTDDEWIAILLDLGMEFATYYVDLYTDLNVDRDTVKAYKEKAAANKVSFADFMIDDMVDWAYGYADGVIAATDNVKGARGEYDANGGWYKLNKAINALLPLQFFNDAAPEGSEFSVDLEYALKDKFAKNLLTLNVADALDVLKKNDNPGNILNYSPVKAVLTIAQNLINSILPGAIPAAATENLETLLKKENLADVVTGLLAALNTRADRLVPAVLPIVLQFLDNIVSEQALILKGSNDEDANTIEIKAVLSQKYAKNFGIAEGVQSGSPEGVTIKSMGILVASDKTMKANNLDTLKLEDASKEGVYNLASKKLFNSNANEDNDGYYSFKAKLVNTDKIDHDKEVYAIAYVETTDGQVIYSANGFAFHMDVWRVA